MDRENKIQIIIVKIIVVVELKGDIRGMYMFRFIEVIDELKVVGLKEIEKFLDRIKEKLNLEKVYIRFDFFYFINKRIFVIGIFLLFKVDCYFEVEKDQKFDFKVGVIVFVYILCLCLKEILEYGVYNQRVYVMIEVRMKKFMWIEEFVEIVEVFVLCFFYFILKRFDEKWVIERVYQNFCFVEDFLREVVLKIKEDG